MKSIADSVAYQMEQNLNSAEFSKFFKKASDESKDESKVEDKEDCGMAHDHETEDKNDADDAVVSSDEQNLDTAVDSLLTASAALDDAGFAKVAEATIRIASFIVEAKKKAKKDKKDEKSSKKDSKDSKKSDDKKDSKKDDKKDSKKDSKKSDEKSSKKSK